MPRRTVVEQEHAKLRTKSLAPQHGLAQPQSLPQRHGASTADNPTVQTITLLSGYHGGGNVDHAREAACFFLRW
jgi:hypothetical protein